MKTSRLTRYICIIDMYMYCKRFTTEWWVTGTKGIHCFIVVNLLVPLPAQVVTCIQKLGNDRYIVTLSVTYYRSAGIWPSVCSESGKAPTHIL